MTYFCEISVHYTFWSLITDLILYFSIFWHNHCFVYFCSFGYFSLFPFFLSTTKLTFASGSLIKNLWVFSRNYLLLGRFWICLYHLNKLKNWFFCSSVNSTIWSYNSLKRTKSAIVRWLETANVRVSRCFCRYYHYIIYLLFWAIFHP